MTSRERFLAAMRNDVPDCVPVAPDISTYIPIKRTGLPFWEVCFDEVVPLWRAYMDAADYFGIDPWSASAMWLPYIPEDTSATWHNEQVFVKHRDAMLRRTRIETPDGDLTQEEVCFRWDPPTTTVKMIKDLEADYRRFKWTQPMPKVLDIEKLEMFREACSRRQCAFGLHLMFPGFHNWNSYVHGGIEALSYAEMDRPDILQEWFECDMERGTRMMELALQADVDYLLFGGSGTITLASPGLAAKYAIPALKKWSRMAKDAGLPTMIHSCGKNRILADMLAMETDINMINPLEVPPMGDIDLAEVKRVHGNRLSFMGNLHTTEVMLRGSPKCVEQESIRAMRDAAIGGGFILSTGDQCGRETPEENIFAMVQAAREFGQYASKTGMLPDLPNGSLCRNVELPQSIALREEEHE